MGQKYGRRRRRKAALKAWQTRRIRWARLPLIDKLRPYFERQLKISCNQDYGTYWRQEKLLALHRQIIRIIKEHGGGVASIPSSAKDLHGHRRKIILQP